MPLAQQRFIHDDQERRIQEKIGAGMSEEEARESTQPMNPGDIEKYELFLKAREVSTGGYDGHVETIELAQKIVSPTTLYAYYVLLQYNTLFICSNLPFNFKILGCC
jgi:hypothetical protein